MKIVCPNCSTTYEVGATSIAPGGRDVRCSRCGTTWHLDPETILDQSEEDGADQPDYDAEAVAFDEAGADDDDIAFSDDETSEEDEELDNDPNWAFAGAEDEDDQALAAPADPDEWANEISSMEPTGAGDGAGNDDDPGEDVEAAAAHPRRWRSRKKGGRADARYRVSPQMRAAMGLALFAGSIVLSIAMVTLREPIVRAAPNLADLYASVGLEVNLRGLEFRDLRTFREYEKGAPMLIVEGTVENIRDTSAHVPAIRLALRSGDAQEIYAWTIEPRQLWLRAGQTLRFSTRLASPPDVASDVLLRFTDRTKRQTDI
ncbi:zinc-ribbon domain-containing protein [Breoghania sp. JC706]|uniref:zinc-ribbon domain-containing protein n=1 Tax=Breoghania sp. JC706 TaxID=3117732 RepID=UPI0030084716